MRSILQHPGQFQGFGAGLVPKLPHLGGRGAHPDVIVASAKAYINALNRLEFLKDNAKKVKLELS